MKSFELDKGEVKELLVALKTCKKVPDTKNFNMLSDTVLLSVQGGKASLLKTDLSLSVKVDLLLPGLSSAIPGGDYVLSLSKCINLLKTGSSITVSIDDRGALKFGGWAVLSGYSASEYPKLAPVGEYIFMDNGEFIDDMLYVASIINRHEEREAMRNVSIEGIGGNIVGTDGHRLHLAPCRLAVPEGKRMLLKGQDVKKLKSILPKKRQRDTIYRAIGGHLYVKSGTVMVSLLDSDHHEDITYPKYEQLLGKDITQVAMTIGADALNETISALNQKVAMSKDLTLRFETPIAGPIKLSIGKHLSVSYHGEKHTGGVDTVGIDADYLLDTLKFMAPGCHIFLRGAKTSTLIEDTVTRRRAIIMPVRLTEAK